MPRSPATSPADLPDRAAILARPGLDFVQGTSIFERFRSSVAVSVA